MGVPIEYFLFYDISDKIHSYFKSCVSFVFGLGLRDSSTVSNRIWLFGKPYAIHHPLEMAILNLQLLKSGLSSQMSTYFFLRCAQIG